MNTTNLRYPAIFHKIRNGYSVFIPDLPEVSCPDGDTMEEAYDNAAIEMAFYFGNSPENPNKPSSYDEISKKVNGKNESVMLVTVYNTDETEIGDITNAGESIKEGLKKRNLTASEAGIILGVSEEYIEDMMTGDNMPTNPMAERMALLFDFDMGKFFELIKFEEEDDDEE